jgi:hypothetical protein
MAIHKKKTYYMVLGLIVEAMNLRTGNEETRSNETTETHISDGMENKTHFIHPEH